MKACTRRSAVGAMVGLVGLPLCEALRLRLMAQAKPSILDGVGVNIRIHEITPALLAKAKLLGFRWLRTDVRWSEIEASAGAFDFTATHAALQLAKRAGFKLLGILDYGHPLATEGKAPVTSVQQQRFAAFARESERQLGSVIDAWEVWNEPNLPAFWPDTPDPQAFARLLTVTAQAIWSARPGRQIVSGGLSGVDVEFLRVLTPLAAELARQGPVAISVHPYRHSAPESLVDELSRAQLRNTHGYAETQGLPVWVSEWGYCRLWEGMDPTRQGELDARIPLVTASLGIPVTILFELVDGGTQVKSEHTCGLLEAKSLDGHAAADGWQQVVPLLEQSVDPRAGLGTGGDHWSLTCTSGLLRWGNAATATHWCGDAGHRVQVGNTVFCFRRD